MNSRSILKRNFGILFLTLILTLSACGSSGNGLTETDAKHIAENALQDILSLEAKPKDIRLTKQQNAYARERADSSMSRDAKEYWTADCSFAQMDDYRIWMDAETGKVIHICRYPVGWFSENEQKENMDFMERRADAVSEEAVRENAIQYCRKAGYPVTESDEPLQYRESIALQKPDGSRIEWEAEYYQTYVMYENGTGATMALFADDGSLLEAWFVPYE